MTEMKRLEKEVWAIFEEELGLQPPASDTDLFSSGTMDSLTFVNLLVCIERKFGLTVQLENIELENFQSITRITRFIADSDAGRRTGFAAVGDEDHAEDKRAAC